jgi:RNA polymerase sigma-B factor
MDDTTTAPESTPTTEAACERDERRLRTRQLLARAHATRDPVARDELLAEVVLITRGVADAMARRYRDRGVSLEDLRQAAYEGLVKAVHRFEPSESSDLLTYAVPTIRGELRRWFRDRSWAVRPPRRVQELQWRVNRCTERLSQELGRAPSQREIAADLGLDAHDVCEAVHGLGCFHPTSLDQPASAGADDTLGDIVPGGADVEFEQAETRAVLAPVLRSLSLRDRRLLYLRYYEERTQGEIGEALGITQMQVSRQLVRIHRDLRRLLA